MSLLLLIDGYNLSQPITPTRDPDPRWLQKNRDSLLRDLTNHLPESIRGRTCVVFDAANPPPDQPAQFTRQEIEIRFSVGYLSADELIDEIIRGHHTPKRLTVVSSDHRVQISASRRGARFYDSQPWLDDLTDGKCRLAVKLVRKSAKPGQGRGAESGLPGAAKEPAKPRVEDPDEVQQWMQEFGFDAD